MLRMILSSACLAAAGVLLISGCETSNVSDPSDNIAPQIGAISGVSDGGTASGTESLTAAATDNLAVTSFTLAIDGTQVASSPNGSLSYDWDTTAAADGSHALVFTARDAAGNTDTETLNVTVNNAAPADAEDPVISSITGVSDGGTSSGTANINATATDNVGVTSFKLEIDGTEVASESDGSLAYSWDTTAEADGDFELVFTARDAAGNSATTTYDVTVDNSAPAGATVSGVVYAPNGTDPVSGALVYAVDDSGASSVSAAGDPPAEDYYAYDYTEANGSFELTGVPEGMQTFKLVKGAFTKQFDFDVAAGANELPAVQTTLPASSGGGGAVEELVVVTGLFDSIENVLAKIGLGDVNEFGQLVLGSETFTLVDGTGALDDADYPNFLDFMGDPANYEDVVKKLTAKDVQKVMDDLRVEQSEWTGTYMDNHVKEAMEWAKSEQNVEIITLSAEEKAKWDAKLMQITEKWVSDAKSKGFPSDAIVNDIKALINK